MGGQGVLLAKKFEYFFQNIFFFSKRIFQIFFFTGNAGPFSLYMYKTLLPDYTATPCSSSDRVVHKFSPDRNGKEYLEYPDLPTLFDSKHKS